MHSKFSRQPYRNAVTRQSPESRRLAAEVADIYRLLLRLAKSEGR